MKEDDLYQKARGYITFSVYMYKSQKEPQIQCCSPSKENKDALVPKKYT